MANYSSEPMRNNMPDMQRIREIEYFQSMYPKRMKALQQYVMEECDSLDYNGSPMYDEFPEQSMIEQASQRIFSRVPESMWVEMEDGEEMTSDMQMQQIEQRQGPQGPGPGRPPQNPPQMPGPGRPPQRPPQMPGPGRPPQRPPQMPGPGRPPQRPPQMPGPGRPPENQPQWLQDIIRLLLLNEIQNRRCRAGLC